MFSGKKSNDELRELLKSLPKRADKGKTSRVAKARDSFYSCVQEYFLHHIDNSSHETSIFRRWAYSELPKLTLSQLKPIKIDVEAYRGAAKTTIISKLYTLYRIACADFRYGVILSSTVDIAREVLETIKIELEDNIAFRDDMNIELGAPWASDEIVFTVNGLKRKIRAAGAGKKIRGLNFLGARPDLIIVDDIENDENVESKAQRTKLKRWFNKAVLKLPDRAKPYTLIMVGTLLHHDSLLAHIRTRADFLHFDFPLVLCFPNKLDTLTDDNLNSFDFAGCQLDDSRIDPADVFSDYLADRASFYSEYQNMPLSEENLTFAQFKIFDERPACDIYALGIDPALGKARGDYFAVSVIGYCKALSKFYWSARGYKVKPDDMIPILIRTYIELLKLGKPIKIAVETIQFQEFFAAVLKKEAAKLGLHLPIVELKNTVAKELRIDSLAPYVADESLLIDAHSHLLIDELTTYPKAPHDDLLDSGEMAFRVLSRVAVMNYNAVKRVMANANFKKRILFE